MRRLLGTAAALLALAVPATAGAVNIKEFTPPGVNSPVGITTGPDGNLWFTESLGQSVDRFTPAGSLTRFGLADPFTSPQEITTGPDGNLWFADQSGGVWQITPAGAATKFTPPTSGGTHGITAGPDGALWYTMRNAGIVGRLTTGGSFTEFTLSTTAAGPDHIVTGPDGALWFTESNIGQIGRITTAGDVSEFPTPTPAGNPRGITVGPDGALWFAERNGSKIGRITTTGVVTEFPLPDTGQPTDVTAGPDGALWFVDELNDKLGRITTGGQITQYDLPGAGQALDITTGPGNTLWYTRSTDRVGRVDLLPPPAVGQTVNVEPATGTVLVRVPGSKKFVKLGAKGKQVPTGAVLDTRKGTVDLTAAAGTTTRETATSEFFDGVFTVTQATAASAVTEAKLSGPLEGCGKQGSKRGASAATRRGRRLWGRGKGRFRTRGRRSSTTVRGTTWLVEDRCDGSTVTTVKQGTVEVRDGKRTIVVTAPNSYVSKP